MFRNWVFRYVSILVLLNQTVYIKDVSIICVMFELILVIKLYYIFLMFWTSLIVLLKLGVKKLLEQSVKKFVQHQPNRLTNSSF